MKKYIQTILMAILILLLVNAVALAGDTTKKAVQYRSRYDNSAWTAWTTNKEVVITGIPPGLRTITIEAQNANGEIYSKEMTVFSLFSL